MPTLKKIVLCENVNHGRRADLLAIKKYLRVMAPVLDVRVMPRKMNFFRRFQARGAHIISILPWKFAPPENSQVYAGVSLTKSEECEALEQHGIPVPRWYRWEEGHELPAEITDWGEYVIRKPNRGSRGAEVKIVKRNRLKWKELGVKYRDISSEPFLQEFIHTGHYPVSYRVGTFFGEPLYSFKIEAPHDALPLLSKDGFDKGKGNGISQIVANTKRSKYTACFDEAILDLARRAHLAFPTIPALGVDIIKDHQTGKLWVIEVNASGHTWHLSSELGRSVQEKHNLNFEAQFGGLKRAAEILAKKFG